MKDRILKVIAWKTKEQALQACPSCGQAIDKTGKFSEILPGVTRVAWNIFPDVRHAHKRLDFIESQVKSIFPEGKISEVEQMRIERNAAFHKE